KLQLPRRSAAEAKWQIPGSQRPHSPAGWPTSWRALARTAIARPMAAAALCPPMTPLFLLSGLRLRSDREVLQDWRQPGRAARNPVQFEVVRIVQADHRSVFDNGRPWIQDHVSLHVKVLHLRRIKVGSDQNGIHNIVPDVVAGPKGISTSRTIVGGLRQRSLPRCPV